MSDQPLLFKDSFFAALNIQSDEQFWRRKTTCLCFCIFLGSSNKGNKLPILAVLVRGSEVSLGFASPVAGGVLYPGNGPPSMQCKGVGMAMQHHLIHVFLPYIKRLRSLQKNAVDGKY